MNSTFETFPKMARLSRECVITEKIDGTNAQIFITEVLDEVANPNDIPLVRVGSNGPWIAAGSRTRWITPDNDNYGFAKWVQSNAEELVKLGQGRHFGEWWGGGIQRRYGLTEKHFSLFNVDRWGPDGKEKPPECCLVVPTLYRGLFTTGNVAWTLQELAEKGSVASPGFMQPEGIVIWHTAARVMFKKTIVGDEGGKGQ